MAAAVAEEEAVVVAVERGTKFLLVFVLLSMAQLSFAVVRSEHVTAIQDYITEQLSTSKGSKAFKDADAKLEILEKRLLPLLFTFKRTGPEVDLRYSELEGVRKAINEGYFDLNPYEDMDWLKNSSRELLRMCCVIRSDQKMSQSIQENVARGYPPMTQQTANDIRSRIRESDGSVDSAMIDDDDGGAGGGGSGNGSAMPKEISTGQFRHSPRSNSQGPTPAQKMLQNIGYQPSKPAAEAPPPPGPAAPAGAAPVGPAPSGGTPAPAPASPPAPAAAPADAAAPSPAPAPSP